MGYWLINNRIYIWNYKYLQNSDMKMISVPLCTVICRNLALTPWSI